jgi:hypothetical protein
MTPPSAGSECLSAALAAGGRLGQCLSGCPDDEGTRAGSRAGCEREVFASDATALLHEATLGAMRDLDRLAAAALREAARKKRKLVERDVIARVVDAEDRARDTRD